MFVQLVEADVALPEADAFQAGGIDPHGLGVAVGVQDLHVVGQGVGAQPGAVGAHLAADAAAAQAGNLDRAAVGGHLDQSARLQILLVPAVGVGVAVGGLDGESGGGIGIAGGVLIGGGLHGGHHAVDGGAGPDGVQHGGHLVVPAQQEGDRVAHPEGAQIAEVVGGGRGLDGIALARHGDRGGGGGGGDGLDAAGDLVGVHP